MQLYTKYNTKTGDTMKFFKNTTIAFAILFSLVVSMYVTLPFSLSFAASRLLGTPMKINNVVCTWSSIDLFDISVKNPVDSSVEYALRVKNVHIEVPLYQLILSSVHVKDITVSEPNINVTFYSSDLKKNNWNTLLPDSKDSKEESSRKLYIDNLSFINTEVSLQYPEKKLQVLSTIPMISVDDINPDSGFPMKKVIRVIINHMLKEVTVLKGIQGISSTLLKIPEQAIKSILFPINIIKKSNKD